MSVPGLLLAVALMAGSAQPDAEAMPSEGFLEYLGTFEPEDEATIVEFALEAEEEGDERQRPDQGREAEADDPA